MLSLLSLDDMRARRGALHVWTHRGSRGLTEHLSLVRVRSYQPCLVKTGATEQAIHTAVTCYRFKKLFWWICLQTVAHLHIQQTQGSISIHLAHSHLIFCDNYILINL